MTYTGFRFGGRNATLARPADKAPTLTGSTWARDRSSAGADDGTEFDATFANRLRANLEAMVVGLGGDLNDGDAQLVNAVEAALANYALAADLAAGLLGKSNTGHTHAVSALTDGAGFVRMTDAERAKLAALVANYKGGYASLAAVVSAHATASAGDWAVISKLGEDASIAIWDADATPAAWVDVDAAPPQTASSVPFTPTGSIASTNVQAAIAELDSEKQPLIAVASQSNAEAGTENAAMMTALRTAQAIQFLVPLQSAWINGGFENWQRGSSSVSSPAASRTFRADRTYVNPAGAAVTQQRASSVPSGAKSRYSLEITGATSVTTVLAGQRIEAASIPPIKRSITFTAKVWNGTGGSFTPTLLLGTPGAADDFTTVTNRLTQALQACANGAWTTVTHTVDVSGYTNVDNGMQVEIQIPSGSLDSGSKLVRLAEVSLGVNTAFHAIPVSLDLQRCLRFFQTGTVYNTVYGVGTSGLQIHRPLIAPMRTTPTVTTLATTGTTNVTGMAIAAIDNQTVSISPSASVTASGNYIAAATYTASAEL
jgi:hypothetical protein